MCEKPLYLEDVFKDSGVPEYTFVETDDYFRIKIELRSKGRGLVLEGPSGIGKTSFIHKILHSENLGYKYLSARRKEDVENIKKVINSPENQGIVIIDDFHRLNDNLKEKLTDLLKTTADEEREDIKMVLIGINKAGSSLVSVSPDLTDRISIIQLSTVDDSKISELVRKGEQYLNIKINNVDALVEASMGCFNIAQILCKELCIKYKIDHTETSLKSIEYNDEIINHVQGNYSRRYEQATINFARGKRFRSTGRAPYFNMLQWLGESKKGIINLREEILNHPQEKNSITQVIDKKGIKGLLESKEELSDLFHYEPNTCTLCVEDPKYIFYLSNINWEVFWGQCGFNKTKHDKTYDFAISFAGEVREVARSFYRILTDGHNYTVFFDEVQAAELLSSNLDEYLNSIYSKESHYIIAIFSKEYLSKRFPRIEYGAYQEKFKEKRVIPIVCDDFDTSIDDLSKIGYQSIHTKNENNEQVSKQNIDEQVSKICEVIFKKWES